jgi:hypothetical protein
MQTAGHQYSLVVKSSGPPRSQDELQTSDGGKLIGDCGHDPVHLARNPLGRCPLSVVDRNVADADLHVHTLFVMLCFPYCRTTSCDRRMASLV